MIGPLILSVVGQTLVIFPPHAKPAESGPSIMNSPTGKRQLRAVAQALQETAAPGFLARRWTVVPTNKIREAINDFGQARCLDARCYNEVTHTLNGSHWIAVRLTETSDQRCQVTVVLEDVQKKERLLRAERSVRPCQTDNLVLATREIGYQISEGPKATSQAAMKFTEADPGLIDIMNVPDVEMLSTTTSAAPRKGPPLEESLAAYKKTHAYVFRQTVDGEARIFVARDGGLVGECDLRKVAGDPIPDHVETYCKGNYWELAWLGAPIGVLISIATFQGVRTGRASNVLGFTFGGVAAAASALVALILNKDGANPARGEYYTYPAGLESMVARGNQRIRAQLNLTAAQVEAAGMRR